MPEAQRQDIYNWECRMWLITRIALDLRQLLKSRTPVDARQQMLAKAQKLEAENAQLRASQDSPQDRIANTQGLLAPPTSPTRASAVNEEAPPPAITHVVLNGVQTYQRGTCPRVFDLHLLSASSSQAVSAWINRHCTATVKGEVDRRSKELQRQLDDLSEGDSPKIDSFGRVGPQCQGCGEPDQEPCDSFECSMSCDCAQVAQRTSCHVLCLAGIHACSSCSWS